MNGALPPPEWLTQSYDRILCPIPNFALGLVNLARGRLHSANIFMMLWVAIGICPEIMTRDSIPVRRIVERCGCLLKTI